jgi:hypothetical protein
MFTNHELDQQMSEHTYYTSELFTNHERTCMASSCYVMLHVICYK